MLNTKYQRPRPCTFKQEDFLSFILYKYVKHVGPWTGPFLAPGPGLLPI